MFCQSLLRDKSSLLYFEIQNNQNLRGGNRYDIPQTNQILHALLNDAHRAEELRIYKPFGDFVLSELTRLNTASIDPYNLPIGYYEQTDRWKCPLHASIRIFEIMVLEALHQNVQYHMWLYYFHYMVEEILSNLKPHPNVDLATEWPTPYHYLLYLIVASLTDYIEEIENIPTDQQNVVLMDVDLQFENNNIPKSSILALGICLNYILSSESVEDRFKGYLLAMSLRLCRELRKHQEAHIRQYGEVLALSVARGGPLGPDRSDRFIRGLEKGLSRVDYVLLEHLKNDASLAPAIDEACKIIKERLAQNSI